MQTQRAGDEYMNAQKDSAALYKVLADTTNMSIATSATYDTTFNSDGSILTIDSTITKDTTYTINRWFEFEKNAALTKVNNSIHYAVYFNNPYGNYPNTANSSLIVKYKYTASFIDGTIYASGVIVGYYTAQLYGVQEALRRMRIGSKWRVFIPQAFAYGSTGQKKSNGSYLVDPYSTIIYDIELLNAY